MTQPRVTNREKTTEPRAFLIVLSVFAVALVACFSAFQNRRIAVSDITKISVSKYADNWVVIHVGKEYDYVIQAERKTELLTALNDAFGRLCGGAQLLIDFNNDITVNNKGSSKQKISFIKNDAIKSVDRAEQQQPPNWHSRARNRERLAFVVGMRMAG